MVDQFEVFIKPFKENRLVNVYLPKDYDNSKNTYVIKKFILHYGSK